MINLTAFKEICEPASAFSGMSYPLDTVLGDSEAEAWEPIGISGNSILFRYPLGYVVASASRFDIPCIADAFGLQVDDIPETDLSWAFL